MNTTKRSNSSTGNGAGKTGTQRKKKTNTPCNITRPDVVELQSTKNEKATKLRGKRTRGNSPIAGGGAYSVLGQDDNSNYRGAFHSRSNADGQKDGRVNKGHMSSATVAQVPIAEEKMVLGCNQGDQGKKKKVNHGNPQGGGRPTG